MLIRQISPRYISATLKDGATYRKSRGKLRSLNFKRADLVVIVHVYYAEIWPVIEKKLKDDLVGVSYDLCLTIPVSSLNFVNETVLKAFPDAKYFIVPNRGRDILPFIMIAKELHKMGYEYFLKLQTKKSVHWKGGAAWLEGTLDNLIPKNQSALKQIIDKLEDPRTGIIGAQDYYYPLTVNFPANGPHLSRVVRKLYGPTIERKYLQLDRSKFGFFGGTMFWGRFDAIEPLLVYSRGHHFEQEAGQIDATYAHALERLFCIIPEINGKNLYQIRNGSISNRSYASDNIPEWSTDHEK